MSASQSKTSSLIESIVSNAAGLIISIVTTYFILPIIWDIEYSIADSIEVTLFFTFLHTVRTYVIRRVFDRFEQ